MNKNLKGQAHRACPFLLWVLRLFCRSARHNLNCHCERALQPPAGRWSEAISLLRTSRRWLWPNDPGDRFVSPAGPPRDDKTKLSLHTPSCGAAPLAMTKLICHCERALQPPAGRWSEAVSLLRTSRRPRDDEDPFTSPRAGNPAGWIPP